MRRKMQEIIEQSSTTVAAEERKVEEKSKEERRSGIDLLRIIAIFLICVFHANQTARKIVTFSMFSINDVISIAISPFGDAGNVIFVLCSSWFLVDRDYTRKEKAINLLLDSTLISISILTGFIISGAQFDFRTIIWQMLPDLFAKNWFVPCYVIFYLLAPIVVRSLKLLSKKGHFGLLVGGLVFYGLLSVINLKPVGSDLMSFFYILMIVSFFKWHTPSLVDNKKINLIIAVLGLFLLYFFFYGFRYLSMKFVVFERLNFADMFDPFLVLPLFALFNLFRNMRFSSRVISFLSSCSLFVYVIHENYLLRTYTRVEYYNFMIENYGGNNILCWIYLCGVGMFVLAFCLAVIYKLSISKLTVLLSKKISALIDSLFDKSYTRLFSRNSSNNDFK